MKLVFPVGLREYASDIFIAHTLVAPPVSAAASTADEALAELREALADILRRTHPRVLWNMSDGETPTISRQELPLFRSSSYDWDNNAKLENHIIETETDVLSQTLENGLVELALPLYALSTYVWPAAEVNGNEEAETPVERGLSDLARVVRTHGNSLMVHRPHPKEFTIISLEIDFEPLNLSLVPKDELWSDVFSEEMLKGEQENALPATPTLEKIAQCWTDTDPSKAAERGFQEVFRRGSIVDELKGLMFGEVPSSVVLVGPPRVGKTALVKHLVWSQVTSQTTKKDRRIWFADPPRIVSTEPMSAGWQEQAREASAELEDTGDILYIGRVVEALDAGKYVGSDYNLAQFLKPTLTDRRIRVVAEATVEEWSDLERRDIGFARCFTVIRVEDPNPDIGELIAQQSAQREARENSLEIHAGAIRRAWSLQQRFATNGSPVGRTIDFIRRTARQAVNNYQKAIDERDLVSAFCRDTGLPEILLMDDVALHLDQVRATLSKRVMGQDAAVNGVADIIGITKAGLASDERPLGSFLFIGPTGVGKTELARALADFLFGSQDRMVRIDMSEYSHGDAYSRLIGEGTEDGDLTGPIRRQPFSVVLLDELEKAHPSVFDLLLQVLGEARLTDVKGRTTRFQNTIIIMTSNLGVDTLRPAIGFEQSVDVVATYAAHFRKEAGKFFRPEFLARIDQFIPFSPLTVDIVEEIASRELLKIQERDGLRSQDVEFEFDDKLAAWLAKRGFNEKYGARPLKRVIEQEVIWKLAAHLAESQDGLEDTVTRRVQVETLEKRLNFRVDLVSGDVTAASTRQLLLGKIEEISELRRRLQRYVYTNVFSDLEWEVDNFDISSQSSTFWEDPNAAALTTRAEHARRVIVPVNEVAAELAALEDLANESFHTRTFAISQDLDERVEELQDRVTQIVMTVLRAAYDDPDHAAIFLISKSHEDPWRNRLIDWYQKRAEDLNWTVKLWRPVLDHGSLERADQHFDFNRVCWEEVTEPSGNVIAMEFNGYAARPLMRGEDGLHRQMSSDGNAVIEIIELDEYDDWPWPEAVEQGRTHASVVRTYNFRLNEILIPGHEPVRLNPENPWRKLEPTIEDIVWDITEMEWE